MAMVSIRSERRADADAIADVVRRAYAGVAHSDHREHLMVGRLRDTNSFTPALSLLAEIDGQPVGHVLMTRARIESARSTVPALALAPLSVVPERRSQGIGTGLVHAAHERAAALGFNIVLLVGPPAYYARFGYEPLDRHPITLPFATPDEGRMVLPLTAGALDGIAGSMRYADGWLDH